jgi:hypothetical protein
VLDRSGTPRYEFWYPYHFIQCLVWLWRADPPRSDLPRSDLPRGIPGRGIFWASPTGKNPGVSPWGILGGGPSVVIPKRKRERRGSSYHFRSVVGISQ